MNVGSDSETVARRPRVLLVAYGCHPELGSEAGVGWHNAIETAKRFDTWVMTEENWCGPAIRRYLEQHGPIPGLNFVFVRKGSLASILHHLPGLYYVSYNFWQRRAFGVAKRLHNEIGFDLVHQVTFCGYREPGYWRKLGVPFVWGPVGGTQNYPWRFLGEAGVYGALKEGTRGILNKAQLAFSRRVRRAAKQSAAILVANSTGYRDFVRVHGVSPILLLETGLPRVANAPRARRDLTKPLRILWSGNLQPHKALSLLIKALAQLPPHVAYELRVLGDGRLRPDLERLARRCGVAKRITWFGRLPYAQALQQYSWADLFVFTSLRDTSGNAALEALGSGVPVICLAHQGIGDVVTPESGIRIPVTMPRDVIEELATAIHRLAEDPIELQHLSRGALDRAREYLWSRHGERVAAIYRQVLSGSARGLPFDSSTDAPAAASGKGRGTSVLRRSQIAATAVMAHVADMLVSPDYPPWA